MSFRKLAAVGCVMFGMTLGSQAIAQDELACSDITWSSVVTDQYPNIDAACDAVVQKNGELYARIQVELMRVRGNNLTFKVLNNDGTSGGIYTQNVGTSWRATIGGQKYRARDLSRGQELNVYLPPDRWAVIYTDDDGPDMEDAIALMPAPMLPKTASQLPLIGLLGAGLLALGALLNLLRRRVTA